MLEVGPGRCEQTLRLARAGHRVTGFESDPDVLELAEKALAEEPEPVRRLVELLAGDCRDTGARFATGSFDVVLCHRDLMETDEPGRILAGLARVLDDRGLVSVVVRNDEALAVHAARAGDWDAAMAALDYVERPGRPFRREAIASTMAGLGTPLRQWYGVHVFGRELDDLGDGNAAAQRMLALEERACRTDPYRSVAAMLHLIGTRR